MNNPRYTERLSPGNSLLTPERVSKYTGRSCPPDLALNGDGEQLKQVILNLVLNAIQAMPDGGRIQLNARMETSDLIVEVIDEITGVAPEKLDRIFTPFYTTRENGTGLGLAVANQIIMQHGGMPEARIHTGGGMIFTIAIPQTEKETLS